eukprot:2206562-Pyramimonas_sp.AAC.1
MSGGGMKDPRGFSRGSGGFCGGSRRNDGVSSSGDEEEASETLPASPSCSPPPCPLLPRSHPVR